MKYQIKSYALGWNPGTNQGLIHVTTIDGNKIRLTIDNSSELAAIALILNQNPVWIDSETKFINTGWETIGE